MSENMYEKSANAYFQLALSKYDGSNDPFLLLELGKYCATLAVADELRQLRELLAEALESEIVSRIKVTK